MYCQECGKESQPGEVICSACGGALTDAELDLPEVEAFPLELPVAEPPPTAQAEPPGSPRMPVALLPNAAVAAPAPPTVPVTPAVVGPPAAGAPSGPHLEITVGSLSGTYTLNPGITVIGRTDPVNGTRPDVDLSADQAVSRRHAEIRHSAAGYAILDLGSTNGTVVNGRSIPRHQEIPLADGDEIRIGENCMIVVRL
jgi:hypothetical protein